MKTLFFKRIITIIILSWSLKDRWWNTFIICYVEVVSLKLWTCLCIYLNMWLKYKDLLPKCCLKNLESIPENEVLFSALTKGIKDNTWTWKRVDFNLLKTRLLLVCTVGRETNNNPPWEGSFVLKFIVISSFILFSILVFWKQSINKMFFNRPTRQFSTSI